MSYIIPITSLSADNLGGVLSIQVARKIDISAIPDPVDGVVTGAVTFFPEKGFVNWVTIGESAGNSSASRASREGSSRNNRLPFRVAKDRATLRTMFVLAEEDEFIVLFTDANGKKKIFGTLDTPVRFRFDHSSGTRHGDLNHYSGEFYFEGPENMFEYDGSVESAPPGPLPAVVQFNGEAIASLSPGQVFNIISEFGYETFYTTG
jgi:hypothetical protein